MDLDDPDLHHHLHLDSRVVHGRVDFIYLPFELTFLYSER